MSITIVSKNNEKTFNNLNVINIGTTQNCHFKLSLDYQILISLQKNENGKWYVVNSLKSNKILFKGQPVINYLEIGNMCKLMIADSDEYVGIKINETVSSSNLKENTIEKKQTAQIVRRIDNKKTIKMIQEEDLTEQDIQSLYGSSSAVQTKIKIDKKRDDIETRRALITKEIGYKSNYLRGKISQNELILGVLNVFIGIVPLVMAYILNDIIKFESAALRSKVLFLIACCFIIITVLLKQGQFLTLQNKSRNKVTSSSVLIQRLCMLSSCSIFALVLIFAVTEVYFHKYNLPELIPQMLILCSALCIFLGIFSGFTKNIISDSAEELDKCESREDFQAVIKDYQQWITLYINNISGKKLRDMQNKIFNLQIKSGAEYLLGIITAPFLAYGVSQTLAECFPEAAAWIRFNAGFKISPIFLTLATLMIIFAFHCFATSFSITKKIAASNVIKQDGFSDYNTHGTTIYGVEGSKNLKKEAGKFLLIAIAVIAIELTMNISYFIGVMGGDVMSVVLSIIAALVPTTILIMETSELGKTKFAISVREELIDKIDKDF